MLPILIALVTPVDAAAIELRAVTAVPAVAGLEAAAELPGRVRIAAAGGILPDPYVRIINGALGGMGAYDEDTGALVQSALQNSAVLRARVGWRPLEDQGYAFHAGYQYIWLAGGAETAEIFQAAADTDYEVEGSRELTADARLHQLDVAAGHTWALGDRLSLAAEVGGIFTLGARADVESPEAVSSQLEARAVDGLTDAAAVYLDEILQTYLHSPTVGLSLGWRIR